MTTSTVILHGYTWKLSDISENIDRAKTKYWKKKSWKAPKYEDSTDDNCEICLWDLFESDDPEHGVGYYEDELGGWICEECFEKLVAPNS